LVFKGDETVIIQDNNAIEQNGDKLINGCNLVKTPLHLPSFLHITRTKGGSEFKKVGSITGIMGNAFISLSREAIAFNWIAKI